MRFPYLQVTTRDFVPIAPVRLKGPRGWLEFEAYVDLGASVSIFHSNRAELLGIDYTKAQMLYLTVGDGGLLQVFLHRLAVVFADSEFYATVGFSKQLGIGFNLLGRRSFFDRYRVCFDDTSRILEVTKR